MCISVYVVIIPLSISDFEYKFIDINDGKVTCSGVLKFTNCCVDIENSNFIYSQASFCSYYDLPVYIFM